ncbi:hypothetical protein DFH08DRAFT_487470 [Mycena albidolilacea]|uniref:Uncharacterized protein n=1 Tax=Mycena albidolilacea TaxID=1033008 RepID=A0AAD7EBV5_9AGAR|nr:hypothetical protein DFH08DRAFT_487470 [Mycena albidolilacea]
MKLAIAAFSPEPSLRCAHPFVPSPPTPSDSAGQSSAPVSDPAGQRSAPGGDSSVQHPPLPPRPRPRRPPLRLTQIRRLSSALLNPSLRHPPPSPLSCTSPPIPSAPSHLTYPFFLSSVPAHLRPISTRTRLSTTAAVKRRDETRRRGGGERTYCSTM